ncbi:hypothetical protein BDR26DRAFT_802174 [Obelidium mucronatum]|nr:hypothetical protein BDR26DRAFT_802174 [Obelidium mucronatum]
MLRTHDVCSRCVLRVLGVRKLGLFVSIEETSKETSKETSPNNNETTPKKHCPACLGLLSCASVAGAVSTLRAQFAAEQWAAGGAADFLAAVRVPVQLAARAHAVALLVDAAAPAANCARLFTLTDAQIEVKDVLRMLINHHFALAAGIPFNPNSAFSVEIGFDHPETESDFDFMQSIPKCNLDVKRKRKRDEPGAIRTEGATWNHVLNASLALSYQELLDYKFLPFKPIKSPAVLAEHRFLHSSLWIAGVYNKYDRTVSNSRMEYAGKRLAKESVEELLAKHVDAFFRASGHKFASAGREDVDVLMLGAGRPFFLEVVNPRVLNATQAQITAVQKQINDENRGKLKITDLQLVGKHDTKPLKDSAATKKKSYTTLVKLSSPVSLSQLEEISKLRDIELKQQTPLRVMISRPDKNRDKVVHELHVKPENEGVLDKESGETKYDLVRVDLTTSAGTYVKEFMHSDEGRTVPSLKELLGVESATVETLDVLHVFLDWPKPVVE